MVCRAKQRAGDFEKLTGRPLGAEYACLAVNPDHLAQGGCGRVVLALKTGQMARKTCQARNEARAETSTASVGPAALNTGCLSAVGFGAGVTARPRNLLSQY